MAFDKEYQEMWDVLTKGMRSDEKASFENIMRGAKVSGVGTKAFGKEQAGRLREKTARAEGELGARLGLGQAGERAATERQVRGEEGALKRLSISEAGAQKRLDVQLKAAEERMKWQWEQQKQLISSQAKAKRRAGFKQLAISTALGAATGGLAPTAFGLSAGGGFGNVMTGALLGTQGMAGLAGQQVGANISQGMFDKWSNKTFGNQDNTLSGFGNADSNEPRFIDRSDPLFG